MLLSDTVAVEIVPAIIPESKTHLLGKLLEAKSFAKEVQVDIVDGVFAQPASWPYSASGFEKELEGFTFAGQNVELDLMIANPEDHLDFWAKTGAAKIVIHLEAIKDFAFIANHCTIHNYRLGIAISNDTPIEALAAHNISCVDYIQLMGIAEIGAQGQPFDNRVIGRIAEVLDTYPEYLVSVDGAVQPATLPSLYKAGARRFVAGSSVWNTENPAQTFKNLSQLEIM